VALPLSLQVGFASFAELSTFIFFCDFPVKESSVMKRFFVRIFCTTVLAASASALDAQVIYSIDFESNADINNSDPDTFRFTTFRWQYG